jgi:dimethylamine/trimethylamine dehydrogenase
VQEGRYEDIRECIGCNICVSGDMTGSISRCTQNTAFMEEWRKGWHPERPRPKSAFESVLIVGAGPTGLEAALQAAKRGYKVTLAEATTTLGGRVAKERALPGLSAWGRVADYRTGQLAPLPNVEIYRDSRLTPEDILAMGANHVAIATGATWRRDAVARLHLHDIPTDPAMPLYTPDDLMAGRSPEGQTVVLYDDDHFYMGSVLAELLVAKGNRVHFVTPAVKVAEWTDNTLEQGTIMRLLLETGVEIHLSKAPEAVLAREVTLGCTWTGRQSSLATEALVYVTSRTPDDALYHGTLALDWHGAGIKSLKLIGDAAAPGPIAWATYAGRNWAEGLDQPDRGDALSFRREIAALEPGASLLP